MPVRVPDPTWPSPPQVPSLPGDRVHLWRIWLDRPAGYAEPLIQILSADERARAERFRFERDRNRFIIGRSALRTILAGQLGTGPGRVRFTYGPQGKPYLAQDAGSGGIRFNMAHSHGLALLALARDRELGVDLEWVRPLPDADQIAARFFSAAEHTTFRELPKDQRQEAFYLCWTRKEAYIKAVGEGLSRPLSQFDVSLTPGQPARLLRVEGDPAEIDRWSLVSLAPAAGYLAALAVEGQDRPLECWQYNPER